MSRIGGIKNAADILDKGWYTAKITDGKEVDQTDQDKGVKLQINTIVVEGPAQVNGMAIEGRKLPPQFYQMDERKLAEMKDGGTYVKGQIASVLKAADVAIDDDDNFDIHDAIGTIVKVRIDQEVDENSGLPREVIRQWAHR